MADLSHLSQFQDGGRIPPVTSPRAACKRSIVNTEQREGLWAGQQKKVGVVTIQKLKGNLWFSDFRNTAYILSMLAPLVCEIMGSFL